MIKKEKIDKIASDYKNFKIATICSHSALQIFKGAREEKIKTIGIVKKDKREFYESFPFGTPDEFIEVDDYRDISTDSVMEKLVEKEAIIIPHGSFVEYAGKKLENFAVPIYGNRNSLKWEGNREAMSQWMKKAGIKMPKTYKHPSEIDENGPAIVKFPGAKGGRGYQIIKNEKEFREKIGTNRECTIQEFLIGVRAYPHYFFTPFGKNGHKTKQGRIEMLGVDRRLESNADEISRAIATGALDMNNLNNPNSQNYQRSHQISFTVVGNESIVLRESLLPEYLELGKKVSEASFDLFGGMFGPFCLETIITENLEIYAFEVSARIVAGTNMFPEGSPYSIYYHNKPMSMGRRIAMELKNAKELGSEQLIKLLY